MIPDFSSDKDILALYRGVVMVMAVVVVVVVVLLEKIPDCITNFVFVLIVPCAIEMAITNAQGMKDGVVGFPLGVFSGKCAKAHGGDLDAVAEC